MWAWACEPASEIGLQALEDRDRVARADLHDGLLPLAGAAGGVAAALGLGGHGGGADLEHGHVEQGLDGLLDLSLVRVLVDAEGVLVGRREDVGLLGHDGPDDHLAGLHHAVSLRSPPAATSSAPRSAVVLRAGRL